MRKPRKNPAASALGRLRAQSGDMAEIGALGGIAARGKSGRPGMPTKCAICHQEQPSQRAAKAHCRSNKPRRAAAKLEHKPPFAL